MITVVKPADPPRPVPLITHEPQPVTGPTPTSAERRAAQERLALAPNRDVAAATTLAHRLARLAATDPATAATIAKDLADTASWLAKTHSGCAVVGCLPCLYLTDAAATVAAWREGDQP